MTIAGHEAEFRLLFAQEAEMRLARLGEQLLQLETTGNDRELVASIFREAHTLKGAAAVVGIDDASRVAHALEDVLEEVRSGKRLPTPDLVDAALVAVDGLTAMIPRLLQGDDCREEADGLTEQLCVFARTAAPVATPVSAEASTPAPAESERETAARVGRQSGAVAVAEVVPEVFAPLTPPVAPTSPPPPSPPPVARVARAEMETVMVPVSRLDELVRLVGESAAAHLRVGRMLTERLDVDASTVAEFRDLSRVLNDLQERTMRARMVPVSTITDRLHRSVRDVARSLGKVVEWEVRGGDTELDRGVLQQLADPLLHLVRNAVDHGIEAPAERVAAGKPEHATVRLHAMQLGSEVIITVTDDGHGIDVERVREEAKQRGVDVSGMEDDEVLHLIFRSGLSTARFVTDVSGRGVGLDIVRENVEAVRGRIEARSEPGDGSEFRLVVPITLAVLPCLLIASGGDHYAIPMHSVLVSQAFDPDRQAHAEGRPMVWVGDDAVPVVQLCNVLGLGTEQREDGPLVVIAGATRRHAFQVDALLGQRDVVVKGLGRLLPRLDVLAGASVEPDGSILLVLDAAGLIDRARLARVGSERIGLALEQELTPRARHGSILVVDDALTVRELQRSILERAGFRVRLANDGVEALVLLAEEPSDLVLTDVEMPRMDGFALTEAIRAQPTLANVPILILTSLSNDEDRQRGLEAGADGYIVKAAFDEAALLSAVDRLLGLQS
jgi:two-component system, chemotaxis family, sensor kinase CheA